MNLNDVLIPTRVAYSGMTIGEVFEECIAKGVQAIPFQNAEGVIIGRISMRHVFRLAYLSTDVLNAAHLLGDQLNHLDMSEVNVRELFNQPAERYLIDNIPTLTPRSPLIKAIAIMEKYNTSYIFVFDGEYKGIVTRFGIARILLKHPEE